MSHHFKKIKNKPNIFSIEKRKQNKQNLLVINEIKNLMDRLTIRLELVRKKYIKEMNEGLEENT